MKIWLLRPVKDLPKGDNPWERWYEKSFGFVVRAMNEEDARELAHKNAGNENDPEFGATVLKSPWKNPKYSTCVELLADGEAGVVMNDYASS